MANVDQQIAQAERAKPTDELGVTGLLSFFGQIEEAYLPELRWPAAYAKFNEMRRRDPTIASLLNAITLLARTTSWTVEPAGTTDPDKKATEFLEQCLADMSHTAEDAVEDLLTALPFGWAWSEIVYKRRKGPSADPASKYSDGAIGWRKWAPRRQSSFYKWEIDKNGGVQGLWQHVLITESGQSALNFLPINKSLHFTAQRDQGNPEGVALLEPVYEAWHYVKNLQIISGIGWERSFVGLPKFTYGTPVDPYTPTDDDKKIVERTGKGLRVDEKAFVALPGQIGFELVTVSNQNAMALLDTIKDYRVTMLQTVLADFLALGTSTRGGSYSLGQDKSTLFLMAVDGWLDKIADPDKLGILNRYAVPRLFSYNNFDGITDYPRIKHSTVQKPNLEVMSRYLAALTNYIVPDADLEDTLRKEGGLPPKAAPEQIPGKQLPGNPNTPNIPAGDAGKSAAGPETGDQTAGDGAAAGAQLADPHPPARGQKWFQVQWERLEGEFRKAMK